MPLLQAPTGQRMLSRKRFNPGRIQAPIELDAQRVHSSSGGRRFSAVRNGVQMTTKPDNIDKGDNGDSNEVA